MLDTRRSLLYKAALSLRDSALQVARVVAVVVVFWASTEARAAGEFRVKGVVLPNGSVRIAEDRYRLPESWEGTAKWLKTIYRPEKYLRKFVINQPGIKAVHVANPEPKDEWVGFNLYEYQGEVRLYILGREDSQ